MHHVGTVLVGVMMVTEMVKMRSRGGLPVQLAPAHDRLRDQALPSNPRLAARVAELELPLLQVEHDRVAPGAHPERADLFGHPERVYRSPQDVNPRTVAGLFRYPVARVPSGLSTSPPAIANHGWMTYMSGG